MKPVTCGIILGLFALLMLIMLAIFIGYITQTTKPIKPDPLVEVKVVAIQNPHTEGSGLGTTYFLSAAVYERADTKERCMCSKILGATGEVFKVKESFLKKFNSEQ